MLYDDYIGLFCLCYTESFGKLFRTKLRRRSYSIQTGMPDIVYAPLLFPCADEALPRIFASRQQKVRESGYSLANSVVYVSDDTISRTVMCGSNVHVSATQCHCDRLFA